MGMYAPAVAIACEMVGTALIMSGVTTGSPAVLAVTLFVAASLWGGVSGGHFNPAVSVARLVQGDMRLGTFAAYVVAQVSGALAALVLSAVTSKAATT
jgi:aquaporin Z